MAKCGHDICPDDSCGWKHPFNKGRRENCRRVQRCFEESCSSLKALGPSGFVLYDVCIGHCHRSETDPKYPSKYPTPDQYICANFDPVALVDYFGVNVCGIAEDKTKAGQVKEAATKSNVQTRNVLIFIGAVILILLIVVWNNKGK